MTLELVKIEEGLMSGDVLYHSFLTKTKAEVKQIKLKRREQLKLKLQRKKQQAANVARKKALKAKPNTDDTEEPTSAAATALTSSNVTETTSN